MAIIFFGLARNLKSTFLSIRKNIFIALKDQGIDYDVFLHTFELEKLTNMRSNEKDEIIDNNEWKMLQPLRYIIENQDEIDKILPHDEFCRFTNPWPEDPTKNSMRNMLRALYSLKQAWTLVSDTNYDGYIILRPDMQYLDPMIIKHKISLYTIYIPEWGSVRNGENDRLCLCDKATAKIYLNRYDQLFEYARIRAPNSHTFLKYILDRFKIDRKILYVRAIRIRADKKKLQRDSIENVYVYGHYIKCKKLYGAVV